ncbi:hypothetical protein QVD17_39477 [Tagetes erecta]|uniref:Uncharacterized protein n=1 Tax=Tagetes erecta TaxID=13708 RepID=A0AAD8NA77_TARER|nr:hypothetical protein QVD17_39477 [Tagetes erecta]
MQGNNMDQAMSCSSSFQNQDNQDSNKIKKRFSLHPTFAHGSTLGLYEVLTGKRYICDIITGSVVLGFFIEAEKILSVLGSDNADDTFLWQERVKVDAMHKIQGGHDSRLASTNELWLGQIV